MKIANAYWISPKGRIVDVGKKHIDTVISNPKMFGLSKEYLNKKYTEYDEKLGVEGQARSDIMLSLMKKGWIRVRYFNKNDMWQFQTFYYGKREKDGIWDFILDGMESNIVKRHSDLVVLITKTGRKISSSVSNSKDLFEKKKVMKLSEIAHQIIVESSLSRIWKHINDPNSSFAVISAYLDEKNDEANHKQLAKDIRSIGLGFIELDSGYSYKTPKGDEFASEKSYMIPNIKKKDVVKLADKYNQQSILWKNGNKFILLGTRNDVGVGKTLMKFKTKGDTLTFDKNTVKAAFSALRKGSKKSAKFAFVAERRITDFPTTYIYQGRDDIQEWLRIL